MWGEILGAGLSYLGAQQQQSSAFNQSNEMWNWQTAAMNSAHEREVNDLKRAGLNPLLSVNGGGASTPSVPAPQTTNPLGEAVSSAIASKRLMADLEQTAASVEKTKADTKVSQGQEAVQQSQIEANNASAARSRAEAAATLADVPEKEAKGVVWKNVKGLMEKANQVGTSAKDVVNKAVDEWVSKPSDLGPRMKKGYSPSNAREMHRMRDQVPMTFP